MERRQFYELVCTLAKQKNITQAEAYELAEKQYQKKHKERRYMCFRSFYHVNYRTMVKELTYGRIMSQRMAEVAELCRRFKDGELSHDQIVAELKQYVL